MKTITHFFIKSRGILLRMGNFRTTFVEKIKTRISWSITLSENHVVCEIIIIIIGIQPLGRFGQRPELSQATGMALVRCILGKFLGVACHCIMWKNMVEADRPKMTVWSMRFACWVTKARHTHTHTHSLRICNNNYCLSTATVVTRTRPSIALHVNCLSCYLADDCGFVWFIQINM